MPVETVYDTGMVGAMAADHDIYEHHLHEAGKTEVTPPAISHMTDGRKVDDDVTDWHFPSEEELRTLRRVPEKINFPTFAIGICEFAERFSYYGATQVYNNFIKNSRPIDPATGKVVRTGASPGGSSDGHPGALGMGSRASTGLITFNSFWCYVTPLFAAYIADTYWGRFKTICWGVVIAEIGHILLVISGLPGVISDNEGAKACFIIALIVMGTGTGVFKSSCAVLVAEQMKIKEQTVITLKSGESVIVDPALTTARIYIWYYMMINLGSLAGQLGMIYAEKNVGYWLAFLLPTLVFLLPFPVLWFGRNYYKSVPPQGSILSTAARAWGRAIKNAWSWNPAQFAKNCQSKQYWDAARPSMVQGEKPKWMTYTDSWVDELNLGVKACSIFVYLPLYWLCYNQITGPLLTQAEQMDLNGSPNELVSQLDPIFCIVFCLLFNLVLYPTIDRYRIRFTPIKRITLGFFFASAAMIWAAVLQHYIYMKNPCGKHVGDSITMTVNGQDVDCSVAYASINVWAQSGPYIFVAISEMFASVVSLEVAMVMAPKNMRSIVMAIGTFTTAVAAALGEAFVALSANPLFVVNYGVFAGLSFLGAILFWLTFYKIDRRPDDLVAFNIRDGTKEVVASRSEHFLGDMQAPNHTEDASNQTTHPVEKSSAA
ncbi:hypothetical protein MPSI1_000614 [Malassezia psittaci]|uniref:Uncharacterized protein n=1 Tax=Malassezia psittaci TaxID=1821823 RepID=A0AAF0F307_9BASI|nr:hypothetical protein MPSI1_000614 [Malassezia psittaci]